MKEQEKKLVQDHFKENTDMIIGLLEIQSRSKWDKKFDAQKAMEEVIDND